MTRYDNLPIYKSSLDLAVYMEKIVHNFSRYHKYTIGTDLRNIARNILLLVSQANIKQNKVSYLTEVIYKLDELKVLVHLCKCGLPIGNLTSQFFANVYLNELDQFIKHTLKVKYYIRYVDDFVILDSDREKLLSIQAQIEVFLLDRLALQLHPKRRKLLPVTNGIDFLGYIVRWNYILVRSRVINNLMAKYRHFVESGKKETSKFQDSLSSYMGHLKWANTYRLIRRLKEKGVIICQT